MKKYLLFIVTSMFISSLMPGQKKSIPLNSDRPDFTNSPNVLPVGYVQFESGINFSHEKFDKVNPVIENSRIGIFGTLVRVGVSEQFEIRFGGEYLMENVKTGTAEANRKGLNALMLGTKFQFLSIEKSFIDAALALEIGLPFGAADFKPEKAEPRYYLALSHSLTEQINCSFNLGTQNRSDESSNLNFYSINCELEISERIRTFVEHYGLFSKTSLPEYYISTGIKYLQSSNIQVDLMLVKEITATANYWSIGAGFTFRVPD